MLPVRGYRHTYRSTADGDHVDHLIGGRINHGHRSIVLIRHVEPGTIGRNSGEPRIGARGDGVNDLIVRGIDDGYRVAGLIGDVGAGTIGGHHDRHRSNADPAADR